MKLNKISGLGIVAAMGVALAGCGDSYLDESPTGFIDEDAVRDVMANDPEQIMAYVNGEYMNLYDGGQWGTNHDNCGFFTWRLASDLACDDVAFPRNAQWFCYDYQLDNRIYNYRRVNSTWRELYQVIDNANEIITLLKPAEGEMVDDPFLRRILGQNYGLRAYCYYWLINMFQQPYGMGADQPGVPIKTEDVYLKGRNTVGEVYELMVNDCETALGYLDGQGLFDKTQMSEYAVAGLYANIAMYMGNYETALAQAEHAMKGGSLNAGELMDGMNSLDINEVLWGYRVNGETTTYYASFFSHVDTYMVGYGGQVGYRKQGASELVDQIAENDVRAGWFGYVDDFNLLGVDFSYEDANGLLPYLENKFRDKYLTSMGADGPFTSDIIYMRNAEFYYVAAEAAYLAGQTGKAQQYLNDITSTRIDGYAFDGTGQALYDEICLQKRIETWCEGVRYHDIRRRDTFIDRALSVNHPKELDFTNAYKFSARAYNMIYQIPSTEIENNPDITEDDQNPNS